MADVTVVAADIRPLPGCVIRRFTAGGTITVGMPVALSAADTVVPTDGTDATLSFCIGVCVAGNGASKTIPVSGDEVDVVLFGPVAGYSTNMVYNALFFVDDDPGILSTSVGTKDTIVGIGLSSSVMLVRPQIIDLS